MKRRDFLKGSGAALVAGGLTDSPALRAADSKPLNLLFITVDDMNYSIPGFMGGKYSLTPSLDRLAERSVRFVNNHTAASICQPSRSAMMTGRVPHHSGGLGFNPINEGVPTLTTVLKARNYFTAAIQKDEHMKPDSCFPWDHLLSGTKRSPSGYSSALAESIKLAREANRPFFINCNIRDPHRPFYATPQADKLDEHLSGDYKIPRELGPEDVEAPSFLENLPDIRKEFSQYCNSAQRMDISIGKVLDVLRTSGEADNTIVLFTADHGMPHPFAKATVYINGTRTPLLLSWPGMGKPRSIDTLTTNIDILPTLLDLLNVPHPYGIDGRSWMPLIHGRAEKGREHIFTYVNTVASGAAFPMRAVQNKRYSLHFTPWSDGKMELRVESMAGLTYNAMKRAAATDAKIAERVKQYIYGIPLAFYHLEADPEQRVNRIEAPEHRKTVTKMKALLLAEMQRTTDPQLENLKRVLAGGKAVVDQPAVKFNDA